MDKFLFMSKFRIVICFASVAVGASACLARGTDLAQIYAPAAGTFAQVNFATLESQVLAPKCLVCHADFNTEQGIVPYVTAGNPQTSTLYTEITGGAMPPGGPELPASSQLIVEQYITGLNQQQIVVSIPVAPSPSPGVTYVSLYQNVLQPKCLMCHQDFGTEAGLEKYLTPGDPATSPLYEQSESGSMPPGGPALSAEQLTMMKTYISGISP